MCSIYFMMSTSLSFKYSNQSIVGDTLSTVWKRIHYASPPPSLYGYTCMHRCISSVCLSRDFRFIPRILHQFCVSVRQPFKSKQIVERKFRYFRNVYHFPFKWMAFELLHKFLVHQNWRTQTSDQRSKFKSLLYNLLRTEKNGKWKNSAYLT